GIGPSLTARPAGLLLEAAREVCPAAVAALRRDLRGGAARLPRAGRAARAALGARRDGHFGRDRELHLELADLAVHEVAADLLDLEPAQLAVGRLALAFDLRGDALQRRADGVAHARARRAHDLDHLVDGHAGGDPARGARSFRNDQQR